MKKIKTDVRLNSVVANGMGSTPECGIIELIYIFLLKEFDQDLYRFIGINQIGHELEELIMKEPGNKIFCNIRYPAYDDFKKWSINKKNEMRLDLVHSALIRIAEYDKKLNSDTLKTIKEKILLNNFSFEFVCKEFPSKMEGAIEADILVKPYIDRFDYFILITKNKKVVHKLKIYSGLTDIWYFSDLFSQGKWTKNNEFTLTGKKKQVKINLNTDTGNIEFINLTPYPKAPYFEMMRADITKEEKDKAYDDWMHSLPPAIAAVVREADN